MISASDAQTISRTAKGMNETRVMKEIKKLNDKIRYEARMGRNHYEYFVGNMDQCDREWLRDNILQHLHEAGYNVTLNGFTMQIDWSKAARPFSLTNYLLK